MTSTATGPVVLVTGGSSGIGAGVVRRLHADGHRILATSHRHPERAQALLTDLDPAGRTLAFTPADLSAPAGTAEDLVERAVARYGRLDALVHCAATVDITPAAELTAARFTDVLTTNVVAAFLLARAAAAHPHLGAVVFVSSVAARFTGPDSAAYEASKAALSMLTRTLAAEYAPRVRINAVAPGAIDVERTLADPAWPRDMLARRIPLGRVGTPADVAAAIAVLLGDDARYLTGQILTVDGGLALSLT
ncbi:SDR family oxidoreductase [Planomonospora sp. ID67723]|uniref:SDR family NAD(P)-dependent oxidoreductase n=1 Tax=Planomonospora sp. ID67723 TaxID=2738134 RepID=UPI0018C3B22A|nr:SDR family NAD(P)-dependent oxidoreductase [Planomonospora sp. ID67723]MBG0831559.1 SDR family oxidoreductase [Planomonospora sp. ID67723]